MSLCDSHIVILSISYSADELWKPDILLYNNADSANVKHYGDTHCLVSDKGDVLWVPPGHFKAKMKHNKMNISILKVLEFSSLD